MRAPVPCAAASELGGEAGLARTRLARDEQDRGVAVDGATPRSLHALLLPPSADEREIVVNRQPGRDRGCLDGDAVPDDPPRLNRCRQTLEVQGPVVDELATGPRAGEEANHLGDEDLAGFRRPAQTSRLDHRCAEIVVAGDAHIAGGQSDAEADVEITPAVAVAQSRLQLDGRGDRVGGAVEHRHPTVAESFDELAVVASDTCFVQPTKLVVERVGVMLAERGAQLGRVDDVGEQHRLRPDTEPSTGAHRIETRSRVRCRRPGVSPHHGWSDARACTCERSNGIAFSRSRRMRGGSGRSRRRCRPVVEIATRGRAEPPPRSVATPARAAAAASSVRCSSPRRIGTRRRTGSRSGLVRRPHPGVHARSGRCRRTTSRHRQR